MTPAELVAQCLEGRGVVAVTGATGWFGATALDLLYTALGDDAPRRVVGYASSAREVQVADGRTAVVRPLTELVTQRPGPDVVLHFAFLTRDKVAEVGVEAYVTRNTAITTLVLDAVTRHRPTLVATASSGAVYRTNSEFVTDVANDPYGALKRLDELAFAGAAQAVGAASAVARVFSVAGPRMTKPEKYALGSMLGAAIDGGPVTVRATAPVYRSYCGVDEIVALLIWGAAQGGRTFDSGGTVVEMGELAALVAQAYGLGPEHIVRSWDPGATVDAYVGDARAMAELAEAAGLALRDLPALVRATGTWLARRREPDRG